ncbi:MAG: glutaredoxin 3 [Thiomicrorhabdus sp.]|nr:glutaredoxin 3 [Thiomicrorhabdus sp.]
MVNVIMYAKPSCPYCQMATHLLHSKNIAYRVIDIRGSRLLRLEMESKSGRNTVPQVFIGDHHVGGYDDLSAADARGEIDSLLLAN